MPDRHRPLTAFVDAIAAHLACVLNGSEASIMPLVRLNTLHRKPNQGAFFVPVKALAQLITTPASSSSISSSSSATAATSKVAVLNASQIQQCIQLGSGGREDEDVADELKKMRQLFVSARHVKDLLHFDPNPVQILQRTIQSVQQDYYKASPLSSPLSPLSSSLSSTLLQSVVTSVPPQVSSASTSTNANGKRTNASGNTIVINGVSLKQDEDPYTTLRRIVLTTVMANIQSSQHPGVVKVYLENDVSGMDKNLARFTRGLDIEKVELSEKNTSLTPHLAMLRQQFTTTKSLQVIQKEDKSWHVDLSGAGLNSVKIYEANEDSKAPSSAMEGSPALATQALAMLLSHFEGPSSCEKYFWVVSEGRQMLASQVLHIAEKLLSEDERRDPWTKKVQVVTFGLASGPDVWKSDNSSTLPSGVAGIVTSTLNRTRRVVQEKKEEKLGESLDDDEDEEGSGIQDEESLETLVVALTYSAVVLSCLSNKRSKRLSLDIDSTVTQRGNTGVFLQYVYARLCGIERKANIPLDFNADVRLLQQHPEGVNLALAMAEWPEMLTKVEQAQDPYLLCSYLFALASEVGQANRVLRVKGMDPALAKARWLLFWAAKYRLGQGLRLCGLDLVERM
ncbi:Arginyl-tRNA synthetase [Actinomortierella ambigua]|nr:Arginyl-tRNA synthetase [Actinomortierella ambigua]